LLLNPFFPRQLQYGDLIQIAPPLAEILIIWTAAWWWLQSKQSKDAATAAGLLRVTEAAIVTGLAVIALTCFSIEPGSELSRSHVLLFVPVSVLTLVAGRSLFLLTMRMRRGDLPGSGAERIAFIGEIPAARAAAEQLKDRCRCAGVILPEESDRAAGGEADETVPVLGHTARLAEIINKKRLTALVAVGDGMTRSDLDACARISFRMGVTFRHAVGSAEYRMKMQLADVGGLQMLEMRPVVEGRYHEIVKRCLDVLLTSILLVLLLPLLLVVAALVKLSSPGPVLYVSTRVGRGGRHFTFFKFRTMYCGSEDRRQVANKNEKNGHIFKIRNDPRVTPLGYWLRRFSIDELAQLFNVLRGDMSLVGPRPLPATDLEPDGQSRDFATWAEQRSRVLPGITGLWQISGRSDLSFHRMVELDIAYVENWSLKQDVQILLETPMVLVTGRGAY